MTYRKNKPTTLQSRSLCVLALLFMCFTPALWAGQAAGISETELDQLVARALQEYQVPGMAIGIIQSDKVLLKKGYGVRELGKKAGINEDTLFKIASNSKAFTTAGLATLIDEGKLDWDALVIDYIPEFRMSEPWVTANFTVTDLLTHRSGLKRFVGDLMLWPEPNTYTSADIIHALRYFELTGGFRAEYAYDNQLYIVAGELIPRISGMPWGTYIEKRLMRPAGMKRCFASAIPAKQMHNLAVPHGVIEGKLAVIERGRIPAQAPMSAAAGGIICSLKDMLTWAHTQLNRGAAPNGVALFSPQQSGEMWKAHTLRSVSERDLKFNNTHFKAYGLGWRLADVHGFLEVSHTGTLAGFRSYMVLIPELELGVVLLSNGSSGTARAAVMNTIVRSFMPVEQRDWIQTYKDETTASQANKAPVVVATGVSDVPATDLTMDISTYTGRYTDPWFGDINIQLVNGELRFSAAKSPKLVGPMQHHNGDRFMLRWIDRTLNADTWVIFKRGVDNNIVGLKLLQESDDDDYDFTDLNFTRSGK